MHQAMRNLISALLMVLCGGLSAQSLTFPPDVSDLPFTEFASRVARQTEYRFYYRAVWVDSLKIAPSQSSRSLEEILTATLKPAGLAYWISPEKQVIISQGQSISAKLPPLSTRPSAESFSSPLAAERITLEGKVRAAENRAIVKPWVELGRGAQRAGGKAVLSGFVRDIGTGEPIPGATVLVEALRLGAITDGSGYYAIELPIGDHTVIYRSFGKAQVEQPIHFQGNATFGMEMEDVVRELDEVVIEAERNQNVQDVQMGVMNVSMKTMKEIPTLLGEIDVIKTALLLPGVQSVGEGAAGFNVRGGGADQNLVTIQQATVFNPTHMFGFFSAFNPDVISQFQLYKSGVPARYGGRIASVFDLGMKDGNRKGLTLTGGVSPITARLTAEGPIGKKRSSFVIGGRSTYSDWLLNRLPDASLRNSTAGFYDFIGKINLEPNANNRFDVSGYVSQDRFVLNADTTFRYQNQAATLSWKHLFNPKLFTVTSGIFSRYAYEVSATSDPAAAYRLGYEIQQREVKSDFTWLPSTVHKVHFGIGAINYSLNPGEFTPNSPESLLVPKTLELEQALEMAVYLDEEWTPNERLSLYAGLRYSFFAAFGQGTSFVYSPDAPRETGNITDTLARNGGIFKTYNGPEFRLAIRYNLGSNTSVKFSYNRMRQYLHRITNTASIAPTDTWKLSDEHIRPQVGDQFAAGIFRNFRQNSIEASVEAYFKPSQNLTDFKGGANLIMNEHLETDLVQGRGRAYGVELLVRKNTGRLNGWVGYTWSRSLIQVNGRFPEERINNGAFFPTNQDKPHDFTTVANYRFDRRFSASATFTYSTGRPITFPVARYAYANGIRVYYSDRNAYRIPDYIRADIAFNLEGSHRIKKLAHSSFSFSVYNLLGRKNVYSIYFVTNNGKLEGYQLSIFGRPFPTLTYNFKF